MFFLHELRAKAFEAWRRVVPSDLFLGGVSLTEPARLVVSRLPLEAREAQAIAAAAPKGRDLEIVLTSSVFLRQPMALPAAAAHEAEAAIGLKLRQSMPHQGRGLVWRARRSGVGGREHQYDIYLAKQTELDALVETFRALGFSVRSILAEQADLAPFFVAGPSRQTAKYWRAATAVIVCLSLAWAMGRINLAARSLENDNDALIGEVVALQDQAVKLRAEAEAGAKTGQDVNDSLGLLNLHRQRFDILATLTNTLPDTVWVSELTVQDRMLYLSAFTSGDVTEALGLIQGLSWVGSVKLDGPIIPDSLSGESRFQVVIEVAGGEA